MEISHDQGKISHTGGAAVADCAQRENCSSISKNRKCSEQKNVFERKKIANESEGN